jgi:hypothetical protein
MALTRDGKTVRGHGHCRAPSKPALRPRGKASVICRASHSAVGCRVSLLRVVNTTRQPGLASSRLTAARCAKAPRLLQRGPRAIVLAGRAGYRIIASIVAPD